ncbi:MAG: 16S rRNA (uracil(1498)-N(3))-methyltransferase [Bacteroidales bacterium]|nr:16S rRNA (uracil(1498)-N(3))-methyltransferase [Bacteroidales bacterium]MBN2756148.1 16S rRNA (uracil(1498)-N(3))-methyltransferase [Bacteroidales bacterium]
MHIFYTPDIKLNKYILDEEESKHCIRVLRLKFGDTVNLIDGVGGFYTASIVSDNPKKCEVLVNQLIKEYEKRNYKLTVAIAPTKNIERFEWFLEKSTEIGIDKFLPLLTEQSERKVIKLDRLNKMINSAIKQSIQAYRPEITDMLKFKDLINTDFKGKKLIAHCFDNQKPYLKDVISKNEEVLILIGPEGDFTLSEIEMAKSKGFEEISLGDTRLRTETAGIVAVNTVAIINQ